MICKIQPPNPNISRSVEYNEKKMNGKEGIRPHTAEKELKEIEDGHVLATRNVPEDSTLMKEFNRLKMDAYKKQTRGPAIKNVTFHMSINPGKDDSPMDEATAVRFADEVMERLGYANQPYRIYKHTDIEREHYHIVSTRCGQDGKKIPDSFERLVLRAALKELAPKYGFEVVLSEDEKEKESKEGKENKEAAKTAAKKETESRETGKAADEKKVVPPFSRKSETPVIQQLKDAFEDTMKWNFSTFEQLQALLLRRYNVLLEIEHGDEDDDRAVISGTDSNGKTITPPLYDADLGIEMLRRMNERIDASNMASRKEQNRRISGLSRAAANESDTFEDYRKLMERKGVYVVISWTEDGSPFGLTYLDRATKCAWKASETSADLNWFLETAAKKNWTLARDRYQTVVEKRAKMPSRKKAPVTTRASGVERPSDGGRQRRVVRVPSGPAIRGGRSRGSSASVLNKGRKSIYDEEMDRLDQTNRR